jgi:hypothetical protein
MTVSFTLSAEKFYCWNEQTKGYEVHSGAYNFKIGSASDKLPLAVTFMLKATAPWPDFKITRVFTVPRCPLPAAKPACHLLCHGKKYGHIPRGRWR